MKKSQKFFLIIICLFIFLLVYQPHFDYPYPFHIDEWHHISESIRLGNYGDYFEMLKMEVERRFSGMEIGFHFFLFLISWLFDLVLVYKFLPAIWAVLSALTLFYVVYQKTNHNFSVGLLAMIFFASLKSNVNLNGLWFFTPLTFSFPLIFLYLYFFSEGIEKQNKKLILVSLILMLLLIPIHSVSLLFAVPLLIIYLAFNFKYILKNSLFFSIFLIIPIFGILFYKYTLTIPWDQLINHLLTTIQFQYGWGVLELKNSPAETYSWVGYLFALVGVAAVIFGRRTKEYLLYLLWPLTLIISILSYHLTGISYFSPYQRNLYYLAISLPFLSAVGLYAIIDLVKKYLSHFSHPAEVKKPTVVAVNIRISQKYQKRIQNSVVAVVIVLALIFTFANYYYLPEQIELYKVIDQDDYEALIFLSSLPPGKVMATPFMSMAIFPVGRHEIVADVNFYGDKRIVEDFFLFSDCTSRNGIIKKEQVKYIISPAPLSCNYKVIYAQKNNVIYETDGAN